ncbi:poly(3-hydroxybutyrate) depolymerase [Clostridium saccharoperbutylacetonicum]|uniref:Poly(3-hydroxybutyrate) depolymerase n=2 Tax=Clostridium TaxID=1485 RepID=M1MZ53_9CLOT|nr:PHB depolymerase family esterase [Clostridium saccharoperbutylacetonicum]AGF56677.1 poly(3-hydroxybutyrate) depolymerase [Clostridium saccharoperbutylacetonicum N1-4(HMT)]NRT62568.1 poly(3-hydroxybutyrate) depolymerase [Clostridium saccharoperbutylacetonicum]NSB25916.1 poly(3-hydroxybutyrate) depolymerase [Clostridium saccharoperbutylacetonicum]NSB45274.1 poly(3-hydroxybutyrate) depolymerase [Clostridium saccharoperbutylacetonicum]
MYITTGSSITIENTGDTYDAKAADGKIYEYRAQIKAGFQVPPPGAPPFNDSPYCENPDDFYRIAELSIWRKEKVGGDGLFHNITDSVVFGATNNHHPAVLGSSDATYYSTGNSDAANEAASNDYVEVMQSISKAQDSGEVDGIKYAKDVKSYFVTDKDGNTENILGLGTDGSGYAMMSGNPYGLQSVLIDGANKKVYAQTVSFKTENGYSYIDLGDKDDTSFDDFQTGGGQLFVLDGGYIKKWNNKDAFEKLYKVDGGMNKMSVDNPGGIIVWNQDDEMYSVIDIPPTAPAGDKTAVVVKTGWIKNDDGTWSYFKADGTKATGWQNIRNNWYYLNASGVMQTGWINDNGIWYYCTGSGEMLSNTTIDGYALGANGAWQGNSSDISGKLNLVKSDKVANYNYYIYDAAKDKYQSIRSDILTPKYYIFAGNKTKAEANELIAKLGLLKNVQDWAGQVYVVNPIDGKTYGNDDKEAFIDLVGGAISNVKIIGIDDGATFANNYLSQSCYFVAGMMLYGGQINENVAKTDVVPVYLSNSGNTAIDYYKQLNNSTVESKSDKYSLYTNADKPLQAVAVASNQETLAEAFNNAWDSVLSKNYRQHNNTAEFYNLSARSATKDYELIKTPIFKDLGITYNQEINQSVSGMNGKYTWFEYVPNTVTSSKAKSVPLVISLHGNQNDPRIQGDSTGWPELAAKENFIVVSPEWQSKDSNYFNVDGLGDDGVINLIKDLQVKYPQIDPSRIYVNGLSLGGAESFKLGLKNSNIFAGVAITSGVNVFADEVTKIADTYKGGEVPLLYMCGDHDFFQMIPVDGSSKFGTQFLFGKQVWDEDKNVHIFSSLQAYEKVNGLPVSEMNMKANEYYGIALDNQRWTKLGDKDMYVGTLSNNNGVVMELAAVKDLAHWNYKPEAEYQWNFLKKYSRNTETGKLNFNK